MERMDLPLIETERARSGVYVKMKTLVSDMLRWISKGRYQIGITIIMKIIVMMMITLIY